MKIYTQTQAIERSITQAIKSGRRGSLRRALLACQERVGDARRIGWPALEQSWAQTEARVRAAMEGA